MTKITRRFSIALATTLVSLGIATQAYAYTPINSQLDFGETNTDVRNLQTFLASTPTIYPQGLVTGYFGLLTRSAVMNFQALYGIVSSGTAASTGYGRVGPSTLAKLNSLIAGNPGLPPTESSMGGVGPALVMQYLPQVTTTTATLNWMSTNEVALGRVYYSTYPLQMNEGDINSNGFAVTTGQLGSYDGVARTSQSSVISGLQPNTMYYYTIVATDLSGNVSVIGPNSTFRTNSQ